MNNYKKMDSMMKMIKESIIELPAPKNISLWWNMGSLLGICLMVQIISGLILSLRYCPETTLAFNSVVNICFEVNNGWIFRTMHANGASLFLFLMFLHIGRGLYYESFKLSKTWLIGVSLLLITMSTAFLGYVLPWGQMSFWGASVITNLISAIPYLGLDIVEMVWGGKSINNATLNRFFGLHFILPFLISGMVIIHLIYLHDTGSCNPIGINSKSTKKFFHPYYSYKDSVGFMILFMMLFYLILYYPYYLNDPDNFILANSMITPIHIQPEWYFLFAYAILRSIPNKLGGVIALMMSIMILYTLPFYNNKFSSGLQWYPMSKIMFWSFVNIFILLTIMGMRPVEPPFIMLSQILSLMYFTYYLINPIVSSLYLKLIK